MYRVRLTMMAYFQVDDKTENNDDRLPAKESSRKEYYVYDSREGKLLNSDMWSDKE